MSMQLTSSAFAACAAIPTRYTEDGEDLSPPLAWSDIPSDTKEFALLCDDPDAPSAEPWVHWCLYKIPATIQQLPEGVPGDAMLRDPTGALQGQNSWTSGRTIGYRGPAPPKGHGVHHYHFRLFALSKELSLPAGADKQQLLDAMQGNVLSQAELVGTYER